MENLRALKFKTVFMVVGIILTPFFSFAYDQHSTHPALTQEIIKFYNSSNLSAPRLSTDEAELVIQGSIDEDSGSRFLQHFYDPVHNRGLVLNSAGISNQEQLAGLLFVSNKFKSSKVWAASYQLQRNSLNPLAALSGAFKGDDDYSWDRAIYEYTWGDKGRGLKTLGHILHLLEDATVPDHTRNDPHPPLHEYVPQNTPGELKQLLALQSSPYEMYTEKFRRDTIDIASKLTNEKPILKNSLEEYFDSLALYSNQNFFSKDTILGSEFSAPNIDGILNWSDEITNNGLSYQFGYSKLGFRLIAKQIAGWRTFAKGNYFIDDSDHLIMADYFSHLSRQAVLHGAGVMKLFFDEVAKEKQTKVLYEKNKSWVMKQWDKAKEGIFGFAGLLYGMSVTSNDLADVSVPAPASVTLPESTLPAQALVKFAADKPNPPKPPVSPALPEKAEGPTKLAQENPDQKIATDIPLPPPHVLVANTQDSLSGVPAKPDNAYSDTYKGASSGGGGSSGSSSSSVADTTAPDISLTVTECTSSLSSSGCTATTTTLHVRWSSAASDLASFTVTCTVGGGACSGFPMSATTATSTTFSASDNRTYVFTVTARDTTGNVSSAATQTIEVQTRPIVINEVGWGGTPANADHEFIELYNNASSTINLSGFVLYSETDMGPYIALSGTIAPHGYYLIERGSDNTISNISADLVNSFGSGSSQGLSVFGENLALTYASTTIDHLTSNCLPSGWCAGTSSGTSMERVDSYASGDTSSNWGSNIGYVQSGKDSSGAYFSNSARAKNSRLRLISQSNTVSSDTTLTAANSPYIMNGQMTVSSGVTLQAEPDVIIKFTNNNFTLSVNGTLKFLGASSHPVVVTSISDDTYGGDSNNNGTTSPSIGDWRSIVFNAGSSNSSILDYTTIRYGGTMVGGAQAAMVYVNNASPTIQNSTLEHGDAYGIRLTNATSTIQNTTINNIRDSTVPYHSAIYIEGGAPSITGNTMASSTYGIAITSGSTASITSNTFTNNTWAAMYSYISYPTVSGNTASGNAVNGIIMEGTLTRDYTLPANTNFANVISSGGFGNTASTTLTVPAGAVVKVQTSSTFPVIGGALNVTGTSGSHAIFTSLSDDTRGGDTNNNGSTSSPQAGDWGGFSVTGIGTSTIAYADFLYGAKYTAGNPRAALKVINGVATISNSLFQYNDHRGLWLSSANGSTVSNSTFDNQTTASIGGTGIYLENTAVTFDTLTVTNNTTGVDSTGSTVTSVGTHTFSGNTTNKNPANLF